MTGPRASVFKRAVDEWYPAFRLDGWHNGELNVPLVEVSFLLLRDGMWRVCAWGGDDFGMEMDFPAGERRLAEELFRDLIGQDVVTVSYLRSKGMERA